MKMKTENKIRRTTTLAIICAMTAMLTACGGSTSTSSATPSSTESLSTSSMTSESTSASDSSLESLITTDSSLITDSAKAEKTEYPLSITSYGMTQEETITFNQAPEKTFVIGQGNLETMLAMGLEDRIVGIANDYDLPDEYADKVASLNNLNVDMGYPDQEAILETDPDFFFTNKGVFVSNDMDIQDWYDRGINVYLDANWSGDMESPKTIDNEYKDILTIGKIFDKQAEAEAIVDELKSQIADLKEKTAAAGESPKTMVLYPMGEDGFMNYMSEDLVGLFTEELGGTIAVPDAMGVSKEEIVDANPDIIIVLYDSSSDDSENDEAKEMALSSLDDDAYSSVTAVQNGHVFAMEEGQLNTPGVGLYRALHEMAQDMYPDLDL